ncbi:MAG: hypothetical protein Q7T61_05230 [Caulobacter sp.]|nr:hypothetical protein [Caulobacter sp.]
MSFDIFLIASSASPMPTQASEAVRRALASVGGRETEPPGVFVARDGADVEFYCGDGGPGGMFATHGLPLSIVELIVAVAEAQKCFILPVAEGMQAYRTPGNDGDPPSTQADGFPPIVAIATPRALLDEINAGFEAWSDYRDQVVNPADTRPPSLLGRLFGGLFGKAN